MLNSIKKIPKKFSIPLFIFAVIVFIITAVLLNLEKIVEKVKKGETGGNNNAWYYILQKAK